VVKVNIIGIDPGIAGALALLGEGGAELLSVAAMPVMAKPRGKGNQVNPAALRFLLSSWVRNGTRCYIEYVNAMPPIGGRRPGAQSSFNFGHTAGVIEGVVAGLYLPHSFVPPATWKKHAGLAGKDKDVTRTRAIQQWPTQADLFSLKGAGQARADAAFVALWGYHDLKQGIFA